MFNAKVLSATIALSIAASSAIAAEGIYLSGAATFSQAENMPSAENYGYYQTDLTSRNTGFRFALGYSKDLNPNFGLGGEIGYNNYGNDEYSSTYDHNSYSGNGGTLTYTYTAVDFLGKATWHINPTWDLYGKLGVAHTSVDVSGDENTTNSATLPEVGLGVSYFATPKLSIDFAVYHIQGNDIEFTPEDGNNVPSIFSADLGVSYYFS
jgi:opacity protein-like surface antigen